MAQTPCVHHAYTMHTPRAGQPRQSDCTVCCTLSQPHHAPCIHQTSAPGHFSGWCAECNAHQICVPHELPDIGEVGPPCAAPCYHMPCTVHTPRHTPCIHQTPCIHSIRRWMTHGGVDAPFAARVADSHQRPAASVVHGTPYPVHTVCIIYTPYTNA